MSKFHSEKIGSVVYLLKASTTNLKYTDSEALISRIAIAEGTIAAHTNTITTQGGLIQSNASNVASNATTIATQGGFIQSNATTIASDNKVASGPTYSITTQVATRSNRAGVLELSDSSVGLKMKTPTQNVGFLLLQPQNGAIFHSHGFWNPSDDRLKSYETDVSNATDTMHNSSCRAFSSV